MDLKIRRTILGIVTAFVLIGGAMTPAFAADTHDAQMNVNVADAGTWNFWLWNATLNFNATTVTANTGGTATVAVMLETNDLRAVSPGWNMQLSAGNMDDGAGHTITSDHISITRIYPSAGVNSCISSGWSPVNPTNPWQTVTGAATGATLAGATNVLTATSGRGCGDYLTGLTFTINVPAGTFSSVAGTAYSTTLTVSDVSAPVS